MQSTRHPTSHSAEGVSDAELLIGMLMIGIVILLTTIFLPGYL